MILIENSAVIIRQTTITVKKKEKNTAARWN